jgi:hypothetical protein
MSARKESLMVLRGFEEVAAGQADLNSFGELWAFFRHNKKWWLLPILLVLLIVGLLVALEHLPAHPRLADRHPSPRVVLGPLGDSVRGTAAPGQAVGPGRLLSRAAPCSPRRRRFPGYLLSVGPQGRLSNEMKQK